MNGFSRVRAGAAVALAAFAAWAMPSVAQTSPAPFTVGYRYDMQGRETGVISPDPDGSGPIHYHAVRKTYDSAGRLVTVENGELSAWQSEAIAPVSWAGFTVFDRVDTTYDDLGHKTQETVSSGGVSYELTQYNYDAVGRLNCVAVRMNPAVFGSLPDACSASTSGAYGADRITKNVYDTEGQLLKIQKAYGTSIQSDDVTYSYTPNGKKWTVTDADGNKATYSYDGFDRLVAWAFPSKTTAGNSASCTLSPIAETTEAFASPSGGTVNVPVVGPTETKTAGDDCEKYAYDRSGNRAKLMKRDGSVIRYTYDSLNEVTVKDIPGGTSADVYYGYDARGLQTSARFVSASGAGISNIYDGFGRLTSTTNNMGIAPLTLGYLYDSDGDRIRITYPDTTYFTYDYDGLDRATTIKANGASTIATITYDNQGRRLGDTRAGAGTTYGYDPVSRLANLSNDLAGTTSDMTSTFAYNPAGQIVTTTRSNDAYRFTGYANVSRPYTVNGLNQYTAAGSASFSYDYNGNLTGDGTNTYAYDVENRMVSATTTAGTDTITYDPLGRLWRIDGPTSWQYLHDGDHIIEKYGINGTSSALNSRFVFGPGEDEPLIWYLANNPSSPQSFQSDAQGSIISVADAAGNMSNIIAYDEYGISSYTTGSRPLFGYTGQVWLPMIGLNYYKARMYSPTLGRFMQTDPIGYKDQYNLYEYVQDDPANRKDPSGTMEGDAERVQGIEPRGVLTNEKLPPVIPGRAPPPYFGAGAAKGAVGKTLQQALEAARRRGVDRAWALEKRIVAAGGRGTRAWTPAQRAELLRTGRVAGIEGHHINTVKGNPISSAENPNNIKFVTSEEHAEIHRLNGGTRVPITGEPPIDRVGMALAQEEAEAEGETLRALEVFLSLFEEEE